MSLPMSGIGMDGTYGGNGNEHATNGCRHGNARYASVGGSASAPYALALPISLPPYYAILHVY